MILILCFSAGGDVGFICLYWNVISFSKMLFRYIKCLYIHVLLQGL